MTNHDMMMIYTDGACLNNGKTDPPPAAGCAFVFRPDDTGIQEFRLEEHGPTGVAAPQTSNRAELRAVIGALQFRQWGGEGWRELVIATDSEYVVKGATEWVKKWNENGWKTSQGTPVKNRDLWDLFFAEVKRLRETQGLRVLFWRIPRKANEITDKAAKNAATGPSVENFRKHFGVMVWCCSDSSHLF